MASLAHFLNADLFCDASLISAAEGSNMAVVLSCWAVIAVVENIIKASISAAKPVSWVIFMSVRSMGFQPMGGPAAWCNALRALLADEMSAPPSDK